MYVCMYVCMSICMYAYTYVKGRRRLGEIVYYSSDFSYNYIAIAMIPVVRALYNGTLTPDIVAW